MFYAAIDAHARYLRVVVLDKNGGVCLDVEVASRPRKLISQSLAPFRPLSVVVETCPFWMWIRDELREERVQFVLAHARELRAIACHAQKNDGVDAHLLARMLMTGLIPPARARGSETLEQLRLVRHYAWLTRYRTMLANRMHGQLHQAGIQLPRETLLKASGRARLREVAVGLSAEQRRLMRTHYWLCTALTRQLKGLQRCILREAQACRQALLLRSVPGIGPYWSLLLSAELEAIERFSSADHLISYAGLAPITRGTGGHVTHGPLPRAANRWVRGAFIAATMSHVRHAPQSKISHYYTRMKARLGWKKARVAAARKLARSVYGMLRRREPWYAQ
jgi:transposase